MLTPILELIGFHFWMGSLTQYRIFSGLFINSSEFASLYLIYRHAYVLFSLSVSLSNIKKKIEVYLKSCSA